MRIATSTIYDNQIQSIDNLSAQYQSIGQDLSTGKSLNVPSDDPSQISQDLTLTTQIASENGDASNATAAQNELTFTDSTLSSLTSLLQTARSLDRHHSERHPAPAHRAASRRPAQPSSRTGQPAVRWDLYFCRQRQQHNGTHHPARIPAERRRVHG
jgi:Bacterial flagellin N-terminal helical region